MDPSIHNSKQLSESFGDIFLTTIEFTEVILCLDKNFCKFERQRRMIANKRYSVLLRNLVEEYSSKVLALYETFVKKIVNIQKGFLSYQNAQDFIQLFQPEVLEINNRIHSLREDPNHIDKEDFILKAKAIFKHLVPLKSEDAFKINETCPEDIRSSIRSVKNSLSGQELKNMYIQIQRTSNNNTGNIEEPEANKKPFKKIISRNILHRSLGDMKRSKSSNCRIRINPRDKLPTHNNWEILKDKKVQLNKQSPVVSQIVESSLQSVNNNNTKQGINLITDFPFMRKNNEIAVTLIESKVVECHRVHQNIDLSRKYESEISTNLRKKYQNLKSSFSSSQLINKTLLSSKTKPENVTNIPDDECEDEFKLRRITESIKSTSQHLSPQRICMNDIFDSSISPVQITKQPNPKLSSPLNLDASPKFLASNGLYQSKLLSIDMENAMRESNYSNGDRSIFDNIVIKNIGRPSGGDQGILTKNKENEDINVFLSNASLEQQEGLLKEKEKRMNSQSKDLCNYTISSCEPLVYTSNKKEEIIPSSLFSQFHSPKYDTKLVTSEMYSQAVERTLFQNKGEDQRRKVSLSCPPSSIEHSFLTPYDNRNLKCNSIAISMIFISPTMGLIGYESNGIRRFEMVDGKSIKFDSEPIKKSKLLI